MKKIALFGASNRALEMFLKPMISAYADSVTPVGVYDINVKRAEYFGKLYNIPVYRDAAAMLRESGADTALVTTVDGFHHEYIIQALEAGCDVITEKPMTIDAAKGRAILAAEAASGKKVTVTFNYRYAPFSTRIKELLSDGAIGDVYSVHFEWLLDRNMDILAHGTSYFRRWNRYMLKSGGLLVHKSTHHFDLVNWWLSASPVEVTAVGKREFYTPSMIKRFGLKGPGERCMTCLEAEKCGFFIDLPGTPGIKSLYLDNEKYDGYMRDRCVFRSDIDIEDTMNVIVKYDTGATMSYTLNAFNAWEGYHIAFNGTKGRIEHSIVEQMYVNGADGDEAQGAIKAGGTVVRVIPLRDAATDHKPWKGTGSHGGGDVVMLNDVFLPNPPADKYERNSDERGGAESILVGAAANMSFLTGKPVKIADMVKGLEKPAYPPMPTSKDPVEMPRRLEGNVLSRPSPKKKAKG